MPTFNRFGILLRLGRPHEPSSRPPGRPSPGEVEAGGHGSGRSKRKVRLVSRKGPRSAENTRDSSPETIKFWVSYIYLHGGLRRGALMPAAAPRIPVMGDVCTVGAVE